MNYRIDKTNQSSGVLIEVDLIPGLRSFGVALLASRRKVRLGLPIRPVICTPVRATLSGQARLGDLLFYSVYPTPAHTTSGSRSYGNTAGMSEVVGTFSGRDSRHPIELTYSQFKAFLCKAAQRTVRGLYRAIRSFVPRVAP